MDGNALFVACSLAEKQEEDERERDEGIRSKMASRGASERGKGFASTGATARQGEDFGLYADTGSRRGYVLQWMDRWHVK